MTTAVQFTLKLPVKIVKRRKWFLASCPILDMHAQGDSANLAKRHLVEALSLFFISCFERGTLDAVLKECGFKPFDVKTSAISPKQYNNEP